MIAEFIITWLLGTVRKDNGTCLFDLLSIYQLVY